MAKWEIADFTLTVASSSSSRSSSSRSSSSSSSSKSSSSSSSSRSSSSSSSSSSTGPTGNNFATDPTCYGAWLFDWGGGTGLTTDSSGEGNHFTTKGAGVSSTDTYYQQGDRAALFNGTSTAYLSIADGGLSAGYPHKSGNPSDITLCTWYRPPSGITSFSTLYFKGDTYTGIKKCVALYHNTAGTLFWRIGYNAGSNWETTYSVGVLSSTAQWYHIAVTYEHSTRNYTFRIWDSVAQTHSLHSGRFVHAMGTPEDGPLYIGYPNADWVDTGILDETVVFDRILSDDEIDEIRGNTYGESSSSSSSSSQSSSSSSSSSESVPTAQQGIWDYEQSFDSLDLGTIAGQDNWVVTAGTATVQDAVTYEFTSQALQLYADGPDVNARAVRSCQGFTAGTFYTTMRVTHSDRNDATVTFMLLADDLSAILQIYFWNDNNIYYKDFMSSTPTVLLENYTSDRWYTFGINFDYTRDYEDGQYRLKIDAEAWTDWQQFTYDPGVGRITGNLYFYADSNSLGAYSLYVDEITTTDPWVEQEDSSSSSSSQSSSSSSQSSSSSSQSSSSSSFSSSSSASMVTMDFACQVVLQNNAGVSQEYVQDELVSCDWTYSRVGGCSTCNITLRRAADDYGAVDGDWRILIYIRPEGKDLKLVYQGYVTGVEASLESSERVTLRGTGFSAQLDRVIIYEDYMSAQTVSEVVADIVSGKVSDITDIVYSANRIQECNYTPWSLTFKGSAIQALTKLAALAGNYEWGVDENRVFFFREKDATAVHHYMVKDVVAKFSPVSTHSEIKNKLIMTILPGTYMVMVRQSDLADGPSHTIHDTAFEFGTMGNTKIMQEFVATKDTMAQVVFMADGVAGFEDLVTDGDMSSNPVTNWPTWPIPAALGAMGVVTYEGPDNYGVASPSLFVDASFDNTGVHQQLSDVTPGNYTLSWNTYVHQGAVKAVVWDLTNDIQLNASSEYSAPSVDEPFGWADPKKSHKVGFTAGSTMNVDIRFLAAGGRLNKWFYIDDVKVTKNLNDLMISLVDPTAPGTTTTNAIESTAFSQDYWSVTGQTEVSMNLSYPLTVGQTYGIIIEAMGWPDNENYYFIRSDYSAGGSTGLVSTYSRGGIGWVAKPKYNLYHKIRYSQSQDLYGIREELVSHSNFCTNLDAQQWSNAYLANKDYPKKRVSISLSPLYSVLESRVAADVSLGCIAIRGEGYEDGGNTDQGYTTFDINTIQYRLQDDGMKVTINAGYPLPDIAAFLTRIEYDIETTKNMGIPD